jgi:hypothetical protein
VRRSALAVASLALFAGACGGSSSSPTTSIPTPTPAPTPVPSAVVVLDATNFDALVLGATRPVLVEFHLPT